MFYYLRLVKSRPGIKYCNDFQLFTLLNGLNAFLRVYTLFFFKFIHWNVKLIKNINCMISIFKLFKVSQCVKFNLKCLFKCDYIYIDSSWVKEICPLCYENQVRCDGIEFSLNCFWKFCDFIVFVSFVHKL